MHKITLSVLLACTVALVALSPETFAQQGISPTQEKPKNTDANKDKEQQKNPEQGAGTANPLSKAHLRIARATDHPEEIVKFYRDGLGFGLMETFDSEEIGVKGWLLGHVGQGYHLEITYYPKHKAGRAPNEDTLLVFYLPVKEEWQRAVNWMIAHGYTPVKAFNPYWDGYDDVMGKTFEDADGYRVVLFQRGWANSPPRKVKPAASTTAPKM